MSGKLKPFIVRLNKDRVVTSVDEYPTDDAAEAAYKDLTGKGESAILTAAYNASDFQDDPFLHVGATVPLDFDEVD